MTSVPPQTKISDHQEFFNHLAFGANNNIRVSITVESDDGKEHLNFEAKVKDCDQYNIRKGLVYYSLRGDYTAGDYGTQKRYKVIDRYIVDVAPEDCSLSMIEEDAPLPINHRPGADDSTTDLFDILAKMKPYTIKSQTMNNLLTGIGNALMKELKHYKKRHGGRSPSQKEVMSMYTDTVEEKTGKPVWCSYNHEDENEDFTDSESD